VRDGAEVLLVCMPFGNVFSPSIGLSLLKAELAAEGIPAQIRYFSIRFAELVGRSFYYGLAAEDTPSMNDLPGEWIFSRALFGSSRERDEKYLDEILGKRASNGNPGGEAPVSPFLIGRILSARERVDGFLRACLAEVVAARPKLVGFTSLFQQHVPSLALARLIKDALPDTFIVFGGANCEDVMGAETVRQFPFVDAAVSGEADLVFPELVRRVLVGRSPGTLPGVRTREGVGAEFAGGRFSVGPMVRDLDSLPYPDYDDYFREFEASRFGPGWQPTLFIETGRGCWWGEKQHCTFCGLNDETLAFRSKSARRALDELVWLTERRPGCGVDMTDNIMDMRYFRDFLPALAARRPPVGFYYEVKANLRKEQVRMLRDAGVRSIQPGIESFSDAVLKLMRKGVGALQNVQLLKWCKEMGVDPAWNLIWGFPGEAPEEYDRMARLVPLLTHLPSPDSSGLLRLDRFSPNFEQADRLGFADVTPLAPYPHVYPLPSEAVRNLASYFAYGYQEPRDVDAYTAPLEKRVRTWQRVDGKHELFSVDTGTHLLIWDLRPRRLPLTVLHGADRLLYKRCDAACDVRRLAEDLEDDGTGRLAPEEVGRRLDPLRERGLLLNEGSRYLALAIPLGDYSLPPSSAARFYDLVGRIGRPVPGGWVVPVRGSGARGSRRRRARAAQRRRARSLGVSQFAVNDRGEVMIRRLGRS
jgi:ribosomal peptide maturation radical SAM protein 1